MSDGKSTIRQRQVRLRNIEKLGGRCVSPTCHWHNDDGTKGCNDDRALQFDHKDGGGTKARLYGGEGGLQGLYRIMREPERYQLLCANCNQIKRRENKEALGSRQHKKPVRQRHTQQTEGQLVRRVTETTK